MNRLIKTVLPLMLIVFTIFSCVMPTTANAVLVSPHLMALEAASSVTVTVVDDSNKARTIDKVPLFNQEDYPDVRYSKGTVATSGCGITCVAMIASYFLDEYISPADLARKFNGTASNNVDRMFNASDALGLPSPHFTEDWDEIYAALKNGQVVISLQGNGLFTTYGHFIVLAGLTEDGKIIVNDPYGSNWNANPTMIDGFTNGFTPWQINKDGGYHWIYDKKPGT